ncbi:hypothetical protein QFZ66_005899 [Streptomyces sp. B4I13]|uniref:hypothetical protein n=1 Tax=Streptomyces sp. B4I13 TaxID=3042271 RepID=UPI002780CFFD|nr:hypothetical protein [Streptomyces sp. B4I13]MDQ0962021.1 hypothetical protein [Streptomyces sp. B4I13]
MNSGEVRVTVTVATSRPRPAWCPDCKANSAFAVDVHALFPTGVTFISTVAVCEICDDPDDPEVHRG